MKSFLETLPKIQKAIWDLELKLEDRKFMKSLAGGSCQWHHNVAGYLTPVIVGDRLELADGAAATPEYSYLADEDTGMYRAGANQIGFSAQGAQVAGIYNDVVGSQELSVNGAVGAPSYSFLNDRNTGMYLFAADYLGFTTAGNLRMIIDDNGHVGINNAAPINAWLQVSADTNLYLAQFSQTNAGQNANVRIENTLTGWELVVRSGYRFCFMAQWIKHCI